MRRGNFGRCSLSWHSRLFFLWLIFWNAEKKLGQVPITVKGNWDRSSITCFSYKNISMTCYENDLKLVPVEKDRKDIMVQKVNLELFFKYVINIYYVYFLILIPMILRFDVTQIKRTLSIPIDYCRLNKKFSVSPHRLTNVIIYHVWKLRRKFAKRGGFLANL